MKFAVLDFETTGTQSNDDIIQVGLVLIDEKRQIESIYTSYVATKLPLTPFITQLTGIMEQDLEGAPSLRVVCDEFLPLLEDRVLVCHHLPFDLMFLNHALARLGYPNYSGRALDTIDWLRILFPGLTTYQLSGVATNFNILHERAHQADDDAYVTAQVWLRCLEQCDQLPLVTLQRITDLFEKSPNDNHWFIADILAKREGMTAMDPHIYTYYRNLSLGVEDWNELAPPRTDATGSTLAEKTFPQFLEEALLQLQQIYPQFEQRAAQQKMFKEVMMAFSNDSHLLIEAGTGTGKSLGYLLPAIYQSIKQDCKVIVSTHTINLQEQLRARDVPLLQSILPIDFRVSVIKGRQHYLCLRKFEQRLNTQDFTNPKEDRVTAAQMVVWLSHTLDGDDEELHLTGRGRDFWDSVSSDTESCLNRSCPWFKKCFYHRSRYTAGISDVVITNHSLLFVDVMTDNNLLPAYNHLVIDEAHHLEETAGKHLGQQIQYYGFVHLLQRLYKDSKTGHLMLLRAKFAGTTEDETTGTWCAQIDQICEKVVSVKQYWDEFCEVMYQCIEANADSPGENGQLVLRLRPNHEINEWKVLTSIADNIYIEMGEGLRSMDKLLTAMKDVQDEYNVQGLIVDINGMAKTLSTIRENLKLFVQCNNDNIVYWIEANVKYQSKSIQMFAVPIDVSSQLNEYFFNAKKSIVMTSATLTVNKSFEYFCEQMGLEQAEAQGRLHCVSLSSPFDYRKQALVVIPRDFPTLKGGFANNEFVEMLSQSLADAAIVTNGKMLALFTSYRMLKQIYEPLKTLLTPHHIHVLAQGIDSGSRSKLTSRFQNQGATVLLGTSSFWEGVDLPGDALTTLAIIRLPFQPPNHPLYEAKSELLQQQKKNPFMKLSVPQAVIKFKQGFGRLVRTTQDRGIVIVYDTRIINAYYGKHFLYSLPGPKIEHMPLAYIVPRMKEWMQFEDGKDNQNETSENI